MQERALSFAGECETRFVHRSRADRPGVCDVYLLRSLIRQISKTRQRRSTRLETREWFSQIVLGEIVIAREVLVLRKLMVDLHGELITSFMPQRHSLECA